MKKFLKVFLILLLLLSFPQVYAEGEDDTDTTEAEWGQKYTKGQFEFTIDGFVLNVYEFNADSPEVTQELGEGDNTFTVKTTEDSLKYKQKEADRVIELTPTDLSTNIKYRAEKFADANALFIDLGLNLTKEKLETLLAGEMTATTDNKQFLVDLCVKYTLTKYPEKFKHFYDFDAQRLLMTMFTTNEVPALDITKSNQQVINRIIIQKNTENQETVDETNVVEPEEVVEEEPVVEEPEEKEKKFGLFENLPESMELIPPVKAGEAGEVTLTYDKEITDSNAMYYMNLVLLSTKDVNTDEESSVDDVYYIMFHDVTNIEKLIDQQTESPLTSIDTKEEVKVGDTSKMMSGYIYVGSAILILAGVGIVLHVIKQKQKESGKRM